MKTIEQLIEAAADHAIRLEADIAECRTRDEHIRVTARANEAANLLNGLKEFQLDAAFPIQYESANAVIQSVPMDGTVGI